MPGVLEWLANVGIGALMAAIIAGVFNLLPKIRSKAENRVDAVAQFEKLILRMEVENTRLSGDLDEERAKIVSLKSERDSMKAERDAAFVARDVALTMRKAALGHVLVLENHIYQEIGPPPPNRPEGFNE